MVEGPSRSVGLESRNVRRILAKRSEFTAAPGTPYGPHGPSRCLTLAGMAIQLG